jgi:immunity protein, SdpI family
MRKLWPGLVANALAAIFGAAVLHRLPERVASHWGTHGEVTGTMSRTGLVLVVPAVALALAVILRFAPRLDPKRRNFPLHADAYWMVVNALLVFLALAHVAVLSFNLGWPIHLNSLLGAGLGLLFIVMGNVLTVVRPNWIFGIRTPWTLSSDLAWRETHRIGGYGFVAVGLLELIVALAWPTAVFAVLGGGIGIVAAFSVIWSYFAWKRDPDAHQGET